MPDPLPEMDWPPRRDLVAAVVDTGALRVAVLPPSGATLVSGDLAAAVAALAPGAPVLGLGGRFDAAPVLVVLARDRGCLLSEAPLAIDSGWDPRGFALTPADDAWTFLAITGAGAADAIAEGCACDLDAGSPSAAVLFAGHWAMLLRRDAGYLLGVESPQAEAAIRWFAALGAA